MLSDIMWTCLRFYQYTIELLVIVIVEVLLMLVSRKLIEEYKSI
jgi:hypothetical protein